MKGLFITFEGSEGSGKSTQSRLLYSYLKKIGYDVIYLREPGGTKISEKIRKILLDKRNGNMTDACEMLLYMASRSQLVREVIKPALSKGKIVVSDRFLDSTLAYQGFGLGMDMELIKSIGELATDKVVPDITFFLDVDVKDGLARSRRKKGFFDRIEQRDYDFHNRVRRGYHRLSAVFASRIKVLPGQAKGKDEIQEDIRGIILDVIKRRKRARTGYRNP